MTSLYVTQKRCEIERLLATDFLQKKDLKCHEYTDSYILPCRRIQSDAPDAILRGGVCSKDFTFIAGLTRHETSKNFNFNIIEGYKLTDQEIEKVERIDECIFGGTLITLFGHFIVESLSRLWFLADEKKR